MRQVGMLDLAGELKLFGKSVRRALDAVLDGQQFIAGPQVKALERRVAEYCACRHGVAVSSGTDALLCTLMALEIGPGDEVITPAFTFFATAACIHRVGATPVFVDIETATFNLDVSQVEGAITARTKAVVAVHLFGQCAEMDELRAIGARHRLAVIEDSAQAIGATYRGRRACSLGTAGCLSFYPTKNLGGLGDGGMILTNDDALADRCMKLRNHGESRRGLHDFVGGNFRLDTMQAAALLVKMGSLSDFNARRQANAARYDELLSGVGVETPQVRDYNVSVFHQYSILCDRRDALRDHLRAAGIGTGVYYPVPLHLQPCFAHLGYKRGDLPGSEAAAARVLSLPVHPLLTADDIEYVARCIADFCGRG